VSQVKNMIIGRLEDMFYQLERMMKNDVHLTDPNQVQNQIDQINQYRQVLTDEDCDYVDVAKYVLDSKVPWYTGD